MASLTKSISIPRGVVLAVCTIIGSGLLGLPGLAVEAGGHHMAALAWPVTILLSLPLVAVFLSLSLRVQDSGGVARYASIAFGNWAETAVSLILVATFIICIPIGTYMGSAYIQRIFGLPQASVFLIAISILLFSTVVNALGVRPASWVNIGSSLSLVLLVIVFIWARPNLLPDGINAYGHYLADWRDVRLTTIWTICALLFWAFLGWENLSFGSEEVRGGPAAIKAIFALGFAVVTTIYVALAILTAGAGVNGLAISGVSGLLSILEGTKAATTGFTLIVLVVIANVNAWVFAASRLVFSAGRAGIMPRALGRLSNCNLPITSLWFMMAMYLVLTAALAFDFVDISAAILIANQNFIVLYGVVVICYMKLNRTLRAYLIAAAADVSCVFLISGFTWTLLFPAALAGFGYLLHVKRRRRALAMGTP